MIPLVFQPLPYLLKGEEQEDCDKEFQSALHRRNVTGITRFVNPRMLVRTSGVLESVQMLQSLGHAQWHDEEDALQMADQHLLAACCDIRRAIMEISPRVGPVETKLMEILPQVPPFPGTPLPYDRPFRFYRLLQWELWGGKVSLRWSGSLESLKGTTGLAPLAAYLDTECKKLEFRVLDTAPEKHSGKSWSTWTSIWGLKGTKERAARMFDTVVRDSAQRPPVNRAVSVLLDAHKRFRRATGSTQWPGWRW
jgi:hypothetical protein